MEESQERQVGAVKMGALDIMWSLLGSNLKKDQRFLEGSDDNPYGLDYMVRKPNVDYGPDPNFSQEH